MSLDNPCPLCGETRETDLWVRDRRREYVHCGVCGLVFVPPSYHLSPAAERARYDQHRNGPEDSGYCAFLARLVEQMQPHLPVGAAGLDFGCGPAAVLADLFRRSGHPMAVYDPNYAPDVSVLRREYAFVTATEVLEHLRSPLHDLELIWSCLGGGGLLGLMTRLQPPREAFLSWPYIRDATHICFYAPRTFEWLAHRWRADLSISPPDIVLLRKPD